MCSSDLTFDSLRYDTAVAAGPKSLNALGQLRIAYTQATYTPAAHTAMWLGHLPSTRGFPHQPYLNEPTRQVWRLITGPTRDAGKGCGILYEGTNVIEGYRRMDFHVQGIGGVSQFSTGSFLRSAFPWTDFKYYGPDMDEEPLAPRGKEVFPLNHIDEIVAMIHNKPKWFLFINCPEAHYPYDWGDGIDDEITQKAFPFLRRALNLRSLTAPKEILNSLSAFATRLQNMQLAGFKAIDDRLNLLFAALKDVSQHPVMVIAMGDHGECFGEHDLYGHMHPVEECLSVPLWMGLL